MNNSCETKIKMNHCDLKEHAPRAERKNREIEERVRSSWHQMPYDFPEVTNKKNDYGRDKGIGFISDKTWGIETL